MLWPTKSKMHTSTIWIHNIHLQCLMLLGDDPNDMPLGDAPLYTEKDPNKYFGFVCGIIQHHRVKDSL